jgi:histidine triad (HIT) family protein
MAFRLQNPLDLEERIDYPDCIFCRIVKGELPSHKVYEDKDFVAFLDIRPLNPGHTLLVPRKHYRWVYDVPNFAEYFEATKPIINAQLKALEAASVSILTLGHAVPHAHIRLVPRFPNDGHGDNMDWKNIQELTDIQMKEIAEKLRGAIHGGSLSSKAENLSDMMEKIQRDMRSISQTFERSQ